MGTIERIKIIMEDLGINQSELAERSELSFGTINRILNEKQELKPNTLQKIADGLEVPISELDDRELSFNSVVQGYLQFGDEITHITSYRQLLNWIKKYEPLINGLPKQAKTIFREEKNNAKKVVLTSIIEPIDFFKEELYDCTKVETWSFRKAEDMRDGIDIDLGNMCITYPFTYQGYTFTNSEALYIAGMFSDNTEKCIAIQQELINAKSGYDAKKGVRKKYESQYKRADWETFNVEYMKWCVWKKIQGNEKFRTVLASIPRYAHIIENSTHQTGKTALFWGASNKMLEDKRSIIEQWATYENPTLKKKELQTKLMEERNKINHIGTWQGVNCMGKILKYLQLCLLDGVEPDINYTLLNEKKIHLFGKLIDFGKSNDKVVMIDMDMTIVDSSIAKGIHWQDAQKLIPQFKVYEGIIDLISKLNEQGISVWCVSGNVESTIKKVIQHFNIPINLNCISGYRYGMTMDNLKRKVTVIKNAMKEMSPTNNLYYIGDEMDDYLACKQMGVKFILAEWGNNQVAVNDTDIQAASSPFDILNILWEG